jgi:hypothetical protein
MTWNPELLQVQANHLACTTAQNDPRKHPFGLYFWGDAPPACGGGSGCFQWFESVDAALAYISDFSPALYKTFDDEQEWLSLNQTLREIAKEFTADQQATIDAFNIELKGLLQIDWIGSFEDLKSKNSESCSKIRQWFWDEKDEELPFNGDRHVSDTDADAFILFLENYGT